MDEVFPVLVMSTITRTYNISKSQKSKVANYGMPNVKRKLLKIILVFLKFELKQYLYYAV